MPMNRPQKYQVPPGVVWKTLKKSIGVLKIETAELFFLDAMASELFRMMVDGSGPIDRSFSDEEKDILDDFFHAEILEQN